ncbi:hypothetical protein HHI36_003189 [Cryptolaemus montrouzieri]|uniref:G-protein coupled receptors family 2 profile 2 domain-containing protein n=1 Tax=Cryptolaemus montrouzieri TaxID=559131 RepID=A0ABD2PCQ0_9CUCU
MNHFLMFHQKNCKYSCKIQICPVRNNIRKFANILHLEKDEFTDAKLGSESCKAYKLNENKSQENSYFLIPNRKVKGQSNYVAQIFSGCTSSESETYQAMNDLFLNKNINDALVRYHIFSLYTDNSFNIRNIVTDIDTFEQPRYFSSKIPFFYGLVISAQLERNNVLLLLIASGLSCSLVALFLIFITAILSEEWRSKGSNIILVNFATVIFLDVMSHLISELSEINETFCSIFVVCCHYFSLVEFFWTSIIALMQYRRYVYVFEKNDRQKFIIVAWVSPIIIITLNLIYAFMNSKELDKSKDSYKTCSLINTYLIYYSIAVPLFITLLINFIIFILIVRHFLQESCKTGKRADAIAEVKIAFILFFLLDLNLIIAIIADMFNDYLLAAIFVTCQSMQGTFLFIIFVLRSKTTRNMYVKWIKMIYIKVCNRM